MTYLALVTFGGFVALAAATAAADVAIAAATPVVPPLIDPNRDRDGSRLGGTMGLVGMGGGAPRAPAGGTVTGGTAIGTGWCKGCSIEPAAAAAAANAEYLLPGALCIVAVGCILGGNGETGGAGLAEAVAAVATTVIASTAVIVVGCA